MGTLKKLTALEHAAANFGFKWETANQIMSQIRSECLEIEVHLQDGKQSKLQEEIGDLIHAVFSLCLFCEFDPKNTLEKSVDKFERRFNAVQQLAHDHGLKTLNGKSFDELMDFWEKAKKMTDKDPLK